MMKDYIYIRYVRLAPFVFLNLNHNIVCTLRILFFFLFFFSDLFVFSHHSKKNVAFFFKWKKLTSLKNGPFRFVIPKRKLSSAFMPAASTGIVASHATSRKEITF